MDISDEYLKDHAVTVSQSCDPGWYVYLSSDANCVPIGDDFSTKQKAEDYADTVREVVRGMLTDYHAHLTDLGVVCAE